MKSLTIAYMTNRKEPHFEWFFDSLLNQDNNLELNVLVVDRYALERPIDDFNGYFHDFFRVEPKPCVWQGKNRLTKSDYFAASNARNTALCLCDTEWIAYVDDLSVLLPGWLERVKAAMQGNYIACGAYQKVKNLVVENGLVKSFEDFPQGRDTRIPLANKDLFPHQGSWLYGCSLAGPVEAFLSVNGWDENCDSCGGEDTALGYRLSNAGYKLMFDKKMMTYESEEGHHSGEVFKRVDKGNRPDDKSHALLRMALETKWAPNYFGEGGIRELRNRVLKGEPFPVMTIPQHDFFDGQPISEM
jgi:hypothetical protein